MLHVHKHHTCSFVLPMPNAEERVAKESDTFSHFIVNLT